VTPDSRFCGFPLTKIDAIGQQRAVNAIKSGVKPDENASSDSAWQIAAAKIYPTVKG
jgi:hypothetical protein